MNAQIAGIEVTTPPAKQRDLDDMLASPTRMERGVEGHRESLRKLGTAVRVAVQHGATWEEIHQAVVEAAIIASEEGRPAAVLSATARASIHDGDDRF
jgi:hypothetical protein